MYKSVIRRGNVQLIRNGYTGGMNTRIKTLRIKRGLTQEKLAELVGKDAQTVRRHENGKRWPSLKDFYKYAEVLECHPAELLDDDRHVDAVELDLIETYRRLATDQRRVLRRMVDALLPSNEDQESDLEDDEKARDPRNVPRAAD